LSLVDVCFPPSHPLHKIFNRNSVIVSYRTCPNIKQIISAHNKKILKKQTPKQTKPCTCRTEPCPVEGRCQEESTIYQATVTHKSTESGTETHETYVGLASTTFYVRHQNHKTTFKDRDYSTKSELSKHIWHLKDNNLNYKLS